MTNDKAQAKPSPNVKAQMTNKIQMTKTRESPSPVLTLALSSKWRGKSVKGEEKYDVISTALAVAPFPGILKEPQPWGSPQVVISDIRLPFSGFPFFGYPRPLPEQK